MSRPAADAADLRPRAAALQHPLLLLQKPPVRVCSVARLGQISRPFWQPRLQIGNLVQSGNIACVRNGDVKAPPLSLLRTYVTGIVR